MNTSVKIDSSLAMIQTRYCPVLLLYQFPWWW